MFFSSIKDINRLLKETNRLLSKEISNIYSKATIETTQNLDFLSLRSLSTDQFSGSFISRRSPSHADINEF